MRNKHRSAECVLAFFVLFQAAIMTANANAALASDANLPSVTAPLCKEAPYLDGVLTEECWRTAAVISNFAVLQDAGQTVGHTALLTHDGQWLYLAIAISHPEPKHIKQSVIEHDGSVQTDDAIEIYLDPGSAGAFYLHYALNAGNIKSDQLILRDGSRDRGARMPWRSATALTETGWNAEMAFPLHVAVRETQFYKTASMKICDWTKARLNICVNIVKPLLDPYGARMAEEKQNTAWSGGHHRPDEWGFLKGIQPDPTTTAAAKTTAPLFWPILDDVKVGQYAVSAGQPGYELAVSLKNTAYAAGTAEVVALDRPVAGETVEICARQMLGIDQKEDLTLTMPLKTPGRRTALVWLRDAVHGGAFETRLLDEQTMQATDPFAAWLDRSYYTIEQQALVVCRLRVAESVLAGQNVVIKDQAGKIVGSLDKLTPNCRAPVALDQFAVGRHMLTVAWQDANGGQQANQQLELVKLEPRPGREIKLDKISGVATKDGTPIFPFGILASGLTSQDEAYFQRMAEAGFNTVVWWGRKADMPAEEYNAWLQTAGKYGLNVIDYVHGTQPIPPYMSSARQHRGKKVYDQKSFSKEEELKIALDDFEALLPDLRRTWALSLEHSNVIGHFSVDEPNLVNPDARITVAERLFKELRPVDHYRPIVMLYACHIPAGSKWTSWSDVLGFDPYIYPGWGRLSYCAPNFVAQKTIELKQRAESVQQAVWMVPVAFQMDPVRTPRGVTPAEQNCQTYLALIHGAKGLLYFVNNQLYAQAGWDALSALGQQMKILGPAIVGQPVPQELVYSPNPLIPEKGAFPEMQAAMFQHPDGRYFLLAANSAAWPVTADFNISGLRSSGIWGRMIGASAVKNLFGKETYPVREHKFQDEFEPYGVRTYVLEMQNDLQSKIQIAVNSQGHPEKATLTKPFPVDEIRKRKNKMPNPSLEIASISGIPDYIKPNMFLDWPLAGAPGSWGIETKDPYHGKNCLRLINRFKGGDAEPNYRNTSAVFYLPFLPKPTTYTFSVYARAAREGEVLAIYIADMQPQKPANQWVLTENWQRYSLTGVFKSGGAQTLSFYTANKDSVIYIDAMQMEEGQEPTEFTLE